MYVKVRNFYFTRNNNQVIFFWTLIFHPILTKILAKKIAGTLFRSEYYFFLIKNFRQLIRRKKITAPLTHTLKVKCFLVLTTCSIENWTGIRRHYLKQCYKIVRCKYLQLYVFLQRSCSN